MTTQVTARPTAPASRSAVERMIWASPFLWVCLFFVGLNIAGYFLVRYEAKRHPDIENAKAVLANFKRLQSKPEVVLMGSSLMRFPFWFSDIEHSQNVPKFNDYASCQYLEKQVKQKLNRDVSIFDMGIDAAMVSDVYFVCEKLFVGQNAPRLIVYGINPRDFMDDLLLSDTGTLAFIRLHTLDDLYRQDELFSTNIPTKADLVLQSISPLYQYRREWQDKFGKFCLKALPEPKLNSPVAGEKPALTQEQKNLAPADQSKINDYEWIRSIAEYEARWAKPDREQFAKQAKYLDALLALAHERHIDVLLIKMPLTQTNKSLMPHGLAAEYNRVVSEESIRWKVKVVDLQSRFSPGDTYFYDTVHLNARGGDILTGIVASGIAADLSETDQKKISSKPVSR